MGKSIIAFCVLIFLLPALRASAVENHGTIYMEDFFYKDSSIEGEQHLLTTRVKLNTTKLNKSGTLGFHFDGRNRSNLGSYKSSTKNERIDVLNLDYTGKALYLAVGRVWPKELSLERIDGINLAFEKGKFGVGAFGGLKPDPFTEMFTADYASLGAYVYYKKDTLNTNLAFTHNTYKGGTDRQYIYWQAYYLPVNAVSLYTMLTADINQKSKGLSLTNGMLELTMRPDANKSVTLGYNQFRSVQFYKSVDYEADTGLQQSYYLGGNYRIKEKYNFYGRVEKQTRNLSSLEEEYKRSMSYKAGLNVDTLGKTGVSSNLSATIADGFGAKHITYGLELSRYFRETFQLMLNGSFTESKYVNADSSKVWAYGASGYFYFSKKWNLSLTYDGESASGYTINSLLSRLSYKF
ncbi:MAG: hypothetical protein HY954_02975 [Deltaproteobacteria bacterium]|nr:hypothetical protein [Deltaproteobacteria bacterium]